MRYQIVDGNRKVVLDCLKALTGKRATYTRAPRFAYTIDNIFIENDGTLVAEEGADAALVTALKEKGLIAPIDGEDQEEASGQDDSIVREEAAEADENIGQEAAKPEIPKPEFRFPLSKHRSGSVCNLVYSLYSKGKLLSKVTGGKFGASDKLVECLQAGRYNSCEEAIRAIVDAGGQELAGLRFEEGEVVFDGFPAEEDQDTIKAWKELFTAINRAAIKQMHVHAKKTEDENEKFAFRTWLTRLGMNGSDLKKERSLLYRNLEGHTAFRTAADEEKWKARQAAKRQELRNQKEEGGQA